MRSLVVGILISFSVFAQFIITKRKRAEEQIRRYSQQLEEMVQERTQRIQELERQRAEGEKLAATGRMAARIAHEINNPLAGIRNSFLLIKDAVPGDHPYYEYTGLIEKEIERIARIVRQMFDLYKPDQESAREFSVHEAIRSIVELLKPTCHEHDVRISVGAPKARDIVSLPSGYLAQVLFNILQNAIEASPPGSLVKIAANVNEDHLTLSVADQGSGIPEGLHSRIFEPFFTTTSDTAKGGLGLGLSISKSLVETMGGVITFESKTGQGTAFRITLPFNGMQKE